jgi:hypothetical protein
MIIPAGDQVNIVWQKLRITFPAGSCTVVLRYCLAKFTCSIRIWGMLFGKILHQIAKQYSPGSSSGDPLTKN